MKNLTIDQQLEFNRLHVEFIAADKRFRDWGELTLPAKIEIIDAAEKLAEAQFEK